MIKKPGPPVPPRPNAVLVANALAKTRVNSTPGGAVAVRQAVYNKSPTGSSEQQQNYPVPQSSSQSNNDAMGGNGIMISAGKNKILIRNEAAAGSWQRAVASTFQSSSSTCNVVNVESLTPLQIETYTKSPSMMRAKRMVDYQSNGSSSERNVDSDCAGMVGGGGGGGGSVATRTTDLISRTKNNTAKIVSLENSSENGRVPPCSGTVVITSDSSSSSISRGGIESKKYFYSSAAGVNNNHSNGLNGGAAATAATADDEDHNFLDCRRRVQEESSPVKVLRNCNAISNNKNYGNECTIGQSQQSQKDQRIKWIDSGSRRPETTTDGDDATVTTIRTDTASIDSVSQNYDQEKNRFNGGGGEFIKNQNVVRSTATAIEMQCKHNSYSQQTVTRNCSTGGVIVVGAATSNNTCQELLNRNRIEIKATEPGRFETRNLQRNNNNSSTTLLIRSGSSASSDSSLSTTSTASLTSSSSSPFSAAKEAIMKQQQKRTEIIINHSPGIDHHQHRPKQLQQQHQLAGVVRPEPEGGESICSATEDRTDVKKSIPIAASALLLDKLPRERKVAFHEKLISELAAMHPRDGAVVEIGGQTNDRNELTASPDNTNSSSAGSPNGSQRSRIRTADWIEVGDNGKQEIFSSCQISLEDSGLEDEMERLEETASSGAGDSWDSIIDHDERYLCYLEFFPWHLQTIAFAADCILIRRSSFYWGAEWVGWIDRITQLPVCLPICTTREIRSGSV